MDPSDADTETLVPGRTAALAEGTHVRYFGDYEILERLGGGGMGVVYRARQSRLRRVVALKMIRSGALAGPGEVQRFQTEARAAARLAHPHVVAVHEIGRHDGQDYFSMDYVAGGSLADLLRDGPLPPRRAAEIIAAVAEAVHFAHEQGVLHRDLKPANVLLTESGEPKVADFGLAKWLRAEDLSAAEPTLSGQLVGTPSYMAPEQAAGKTVLVGPATEVYALGAVLYACLTGRPPFAAASVPETLLDVLRRDPLPPRTLSPSVPRDLETVCLKCLHKEPHRRYPTAKHLADDLRRYLAGRPVTARPVGRVGRLWRWSRRNPAVASLLALVVLTTAAGFAAVVWQWRQSEHFRKQAVVGRDKALTAEGKAVTNFENAERERHAAERARSDAQARLARLYVERALPRLADDPVAALPWLTEALSLSEAAGRSDDVERLRVGTILRMTPRIIAYHPDVPRSALSSYVLRAMPSPDGRRIAIARGEQVEIADADANVLHALPHDRSVDAMLFHPGGRALLTATGVQSGTPSRELTVRLWDFETGRLLAGPAVIGNPKFPQADSQGGGSLRFSPDGAWLVATSWNNGQWVLADTAVALFDARTLEPIANEFMYRGRFDFTFTDPVLSPDYRRAFTKSQLAGEGLDDQTLNASSAERLGDYEWRGRVWDVRTGKPLTPVLPPKDVRHAVFSPDSRRVLVFTEAGTAQVFDAQSGEAVSPVLGEKLPLAQRASFHPDGSRFAAADATGRVLVLGTDTGKVLDSVTGRAVMDGPQFSPDGRFLFYRDEQEAHVWWPRTGDGVALPDEADEADAEEEPVRLVSFAVTEWPTSFTVTPDGSRLLFKDRGRIHVRDAMTGRPVTPPLPHDFEFAVTTDGRRLLTVGADGLRVWELPQVPLLAVQDEKLPAAPRAVELAEADETVLGVSTDGRHVVVVRGPADEVSPTSPSFLTVQRRRLGDGSPSGPLVTLLVDRESALVPSPDGRLVACFLPLGGVGVWDLTSGEQLPHEFRHPEWAVGWRRQSHLLAFSPDGSRLASASLNKTEVRVWEIATGRLVGPPITPVPPDEIIVREIALRPDNRVLAVVHNEQLRLWDCESGLPVTPTLPLPWTDGMFLASLGAKGADGMPACRFTPDGLRLFVTRKDGSRKNRLAVFDLPREDRPAAELTHLAAFLAGYRIEEDGTAVPLSAADYARAWTEFRSARGAKP
jgi:WD40 repeat protein